MHPDWEVMESFDAQDMAIYQLENTVIFSDTILPICLPYSGKN